MVLANDDEATPIGLVGKKSSADSCQRRWYCDAGKFDIVHYVDEHFGKKILSEHVRPEIEAWLKRSWQLLWSSYDCTLYANWFSGI